MKREKSVKAPWTTWVCWIGVAVWGYANWVENRRLLQQVLEFRTAQSREDSEAQQPLAGAQVEFPSSTELTGIRVEIASLRRLIEERLESGSHENKAVSSIGSATLGMTSSVPLPSYVRRGWVDRSGIPEAVLLGIRKQLGEVPVEGAHVKQGEGHIFYSLESKTSEGRSIELALNQDGQVVRRHAEIGMSGLPEGLQQTVQLAVGDIPVQRVAEVFEEGRTVYRVNAKAPQQAIEIVLSPDGQVLRTETTVRETRP